MEKINMFTALKKYADFKGCASRKEYWLFILFLLSGAVLLYLPGCILSDFYRIGYGKTVSGAAICIFLLVMFLPLLSLSVRRCHDAGHTAWWLLVLFIPFAGPAMWLATACLPPLPEVRSDEAQM